MPLRYYEGLDPESARDFERHLASCPACAAEWARTRLCLDGVDADAAFPRESEVDWGSFARDTAARARRAEAAGRSAMASDRSGVLAGAAGWLRRAVPAAAVRARRAAEAAAHLPVPARWGAAAAALLSGITLMMMMDGSRGPQPPPAPVAEGRPAPGADVAPGVSESPGVAAAPEGARFIEGRLARQGAARYLADSRALLVNLVQSPVPCRRTDGDFDIRIEKRRARELLRRKNLYEGALGGLEDARLAGLVRQLESVLLQVSSLEDCATARQIHDLGEAIERRRILLRIDLMTRDAAEGGSRA
jgi:hypothetical protein